MMIQAKDRKIIALAATSRIICLSLTILADLAFTDLATSAHLSNFQCLSPTSPSLHLDPSLSTSVDHLASWDSMYFVRIAKCGYENDMIHAFFPLLPVLMRTLDIFTGSRWMLGHRFPPESRYTLHGILISFASFIIAALALHKLSYEIFSSYLLSKSRNNNKKQRYSGCKSTADGMKIPNRLANSAVLLFCYNPASIFYTIGYTESLFAACTFTGMYLLHKNRLLLSTLAFTAGAASRSNGVLSIWFPIHRLLSHIYTTWWHHRYGISNIQAPSTVYRRPRDAHRHNHHPHHPKTIATKPKYSTWSSCVGETIKTLLACTCICLPYLIIQVIAHLTYCTSSNAADDPERAWCTTRKMGGILVVPSIYSHVQDKYWDVGFLRFYTKLDRWPNIVQSVPIFGLCIAACWVYFSSNWERTFHLDLWTEDNNNSIGDDHDTNNAAVTTTPPLPSRRDTSSSLSSSSPVKKKGCSTTCVWQRYLLNNDTPAPYFHYTALMTAIAILIMHVNVGTRFLSTCPPLYWYVATLMYPYYYYCNVVGGRGKWVRKGVWVWCLSFTVAGCVLWPNFYPWT